MTNLEAGLVIIAACSLISSVSCMFAAFRLNDVLKVLTLNMAIDRDIHRRLCRKDAPPKNVP